MIARAVFVDRDGVINANFERDNRPVAPTRMDDFRFLPGVKDALRDLSAAGYAIIVITNQPDVASGRTPRETVEAMHALIRAELAVDEIKACFHLDADGCPCRKPKPGMILEAASERGLDLARSYVIGDRWRDIDAGRAAGCATILVGDGNEQDGVSQPDSRCASLPDAARLILAATAGGIAPALKSPRQEGNREMDMPTAGGLSVKIFADGADLQDIAELAADPLIKGFTTNPTLMRQAGVTDYKAFALDVLRVIPHRPVSFEVFADDFPTMAAQAREIASWGDNVYVKVPVSDTAGVFAGPLISELSHAGVKLNVTAVMTLDQVRRIAEALIKDIPAIVSVFAGRIADTGRDPVPHMEAAAGILKSRPHAELLWASPRELLNIFQADAIGCHIITVTKDLIKKLALVGKDLDGYSRETVSMFRRDAVAAGFDIPVAPTPAATLKSAAA